MDMYDLLEVLIFNPLNPVAVLYGCGRLSDIHGPLEGLRNKPLLPA